MAGGVAYNWAAAASDGESDPSPKVFERDRLKRLKGDLEDLDVGMPVALFVEDWVEGSGLPLVALVCEVDLFCRFGEEALGLTA